jgi:hypothetical protein
MCCRGSPVVVGGLAEGGGVEAVCTTHGACPTHLHPCCLPGSQAIAACCISAFPFVCVCSAVRCMYCCQLRVFVGGLAEVWWTQPSFYHAWCPPHPPSSNLPAWLAACLLLLLQSLCLPVQCCMLYVWLTGAHQLSLCCGWVGWRVVAQSSLLTSMLPVPPTFTHAACLACSLLPAAFGKLPLFACTVLHAVCVDRGPSA